MTDTEPRLPKRADLELPLLRILIALGDEVDFSALGREIEIQLATEMRLSDYELDFSAPNYHSEGNRKWRNHIQFVRDQLVKKGYLDNSRRGYWIVTFWGYDLAKQNPHYFKVLASPKT